MWRTLPVLAILAFVVAYATEPDVPPATRAMLAVLAAILLGVIFAIAL